MKFLLILLLSYTLQAAGFWTLSGLEKANVYVSNGLTTLKGETLKKIKTKMRESLHSNGIKTEQKDSATLMISLQEIVDEESYFIYVKLALGEEVQTFRADESATFALTYDANDFIETDKEDLDKEVLESVDFLLSKFSEQFEDDKE